MKSKWSEIALAVVIVVVLYEMYNANQNGNGPFSGWSVLGGQAG